MKKILVILAIAVALVMPLMANGSSEQGGAEKNVTLKIGFQANTSSNEYKAAELLAQILLCNI